MNFVDAIKSGFSKFATCKGRASRSEFWYWQLFVFLTSVIAYLLDEEFLVQGKMFDTIHTLVFFIPCIAVTARRLQDTNRSQWLWLLAITIVGLIPLTIWFCQKGTVGDNRFGPDPLAEKMTAA